MQESTFHSNIDATFAIGTCPQPLCPHERLSNSLDELNRRRRLANPQWIADEIDATAAEIIRMLHDELPEFADTLNQLFSYHTAGGVLLSKLATTYPNLVRKRVVTGIATWTIYPGGWGSFRLEREGVCSTW